MSLANVHIAIHLSLLWSVEVGRNTQRRALIVVRCPQSWTLSLLCDPTSNRRLGFHSRGLSSYMGRRAVRRAARLGVHPPRLRGGKLERHFPELVSVFERNTAELIALSASLYGDLHNAYSPIPIEQD